MLRRDEEAVIAEFQRRRRRLLVSFGFTMALLALGIAALQISDDFPNLLKLGRHMWKTVALGQLLAAVIIALSGFLQYRCPVCHEIPRGHDKYYLGVAIDPERCPHCKARLSR